MVNLQLQRLKVAFYVVWILPRILRNLESCLRNSTSKMADSRCIFLNNHWRIMRPYIHDKTPWLFSISAIQSIGKKSCSNLYFFPHRWRVIEQAWPVTDSSWTWETYCSHCVNLSWIRNLQNWQESTRVTVLHPQQLIRYLKRAQLSICAACKPRRSSVHLNPKVKSYFSE